MNKPMNTESTQQLPDMEQLLDQLIAGEISQTGLAALAEAAEHDAEFAVQLQHAQQLRDALDQLPPQRVSDTLQQRLLNIPRQHPEAQAALRGWWLPTAVAAALAVALVLPQLSQRPSPEDLVQARQEVAVALSYFDHYSQAPIAREVGQQLESALRSGLGSHLPPAITSQPNS